MSHAQLRASDRRNMALAGYASARINRVAERFALPRKVGRPPLSPIDRAIRDARRLTARIRELTSEATQ